MTIGGLGPALGIGLGGALVPNLVLQFEVSLSAVDDPAIESAGNDLSVDGAGAAILGFGPSLTLYAMPANVAFTGALLATKSSISIDDDPISESETGVGLAFRVAKQWAMNQVGLGISAQYQFASLTEQGTDNDIFADGFSVNLMLSNR